MSEGLQRIVVLSVLATPFAVGSLRTWAAAPSDERSRPPEVWGRLIRLAHEQSDAIRAAQQAEVAARGEGRQLHRQAHWPDLALLAQANRSRVDTNGLSVRTPAAQAQLTLSLPVLRRSEQAAARAQWATADQNAWLVRTQRIEVAVATSDALLAAIGAAEQQRLLEFRTDLLRQLLQLNARRLSAGIGSRLEMLETQARLDQTHAALATQRSVLANSRVALLRLCRVDVALPAGLAPADTAPMRRVVPPLDEALVMVADRNPNLLAASAELRASEESRAARRAALSLPTVDASASWSAARAAPRADGSDEVVQRTRGIAMGVLLQWTLPVNGALQAALDAASARVERARARRADVLSLVEAEIRSVYASIEHASAVLEALNDAERSLVSSVEALQKAYAAGARSNSDLLNGEQLLLAARQSQVETRIGLLAAQVRVLAALDLLEPERVAALDSSFLAIAPAATP